MPYEDQDFIMRQIKGYAKGIGVLLDISSLKDFLKLEFSVDEVSDREIESIIYTAGIELVSTTRMLSRVKLKSCWACLLNVWNVSNVITSEAPPSRTSNAEKTDRR
ncbi:MAG: hypothetical protein U5K84_10115 [Alkalibacterium sp.]|nr:hypothetical protein [Alkalibacterium sp.]